MDIDMSNDTNSEIRWFHSFELDNGEKINGLKKINVLKEESNIIFGNDAEGKTVLDIGSWDGYFSFEAEKRGASRVVATDHFCWSGEGWGTKAGFDYIHQKTNSQVKAIDVDVHQLPDLGIGQFDLVLFLGVFYHLKDPYVGLEAAAKMSSNMLVVETVTALPTEKLPAMRLFDSGELGGDPTNFWAPNLPALQLMLKMFGFSRIEFTASPISSNHPLSAGLLRKPTSKSVHRTIVRAWR